MALQGGVNSALNNKLDVLLTNFIVHFSAALLLIIPVCWRYKEFTNNFRQVPWYYYSGGFLAIVITTGVIISLPPLGAARGTAAIVAAQVLTAALIDHFGILGFEKDPFTWFKMIGVLLIVAGVRIILK